MGGDHSSDCPRHCIHQETRLISSAKLLAIYAEIARVLSPALNTGAWLCMLPPSRFSVTTPSTLLASLISLPSAFTSGSQRHSGHLICAQLSIPSALVLGYLSALTWAGALRVQSTHGRSGRSPGRRPASYKAKLEPCELTLCLVLFNVMSCCASQSSIWTWAGRLGGRPRSLAPT